MRSFDTPEPIIATVEVGVGDVRVAASERPDTVVEVRPSHPDRHQDVQAAEQTRVEFAGGRLLVKMPKNWKRWSPFSDGESIDVSIELPEGSQLIVSCGVASLSATGTLGDTRLASGGGDVHLERTGTLRARSGFGEIDIEQVAGDADIAVGSGTAHIGAIDGAATIKNSNGDSWVGLAGKDLRINSANGNITVDRARGTVVAKTANGDVRLGAVERGAVVAETGHGGLEIGIPDGTPAYLDLHTHFGRVESELDGAPEPETREDAVHVRARTGLGDVWVRRA
jgi:DUF4097 and DUF4098 domain-containing protein YvlB